MLTLAEASKLTNDVLLRGIIQTIVTESEVLQHLPFREVVGNALTYNRESTMPTADFFDSGDVWTENTGTNAQATATLKILGGDADVDEFQKRTMSDQNDIEALTIESKSKAIAYTFDKTFIYGDNSANSKEFDGLHRLVASAMQYHAGSGTTAGALSLSLLDQAIDAVKPGRPDAIVMNKNLRRRLAGFYRSTGSGQWHMERGDDGKVITTYGGIPVLLDDYLLQTEAIASAAYSASTGGSSSSIFVVKFGQTDLAGLQNGGISKQKIGMLQDKDAQRWRIKWYCGLALFSTLSLARIDGIADAAVTT